MERGYFGVAEHYILYRFEHTKQRKEEVVKEIDKNRLMIKTPEGEEQFSRERMRAYVARFTHGFESDINTDEIINQIESEVYAGITTAELAKLVTLILRAKIEIAPAYSYVAARQLCDRLYSEVIGETRDLSPAEFTQTYRDTKHTQHLSLIHISEPTRPY